MDWKDLKSIVSKAAPLLGATLGGPAGATVGTLISKTLGTDNTPDAVAEVIASGELITGNMDAMKMLRQIENEHETELIKLQLEESRMLMADRQHAREQNGDHWMPAVLTIALAVMVAAMFGGILALGVPESVSSIVYMIAGQVLTAFLTCVAFWVGTSRSSQEKNRLLKKE